MNAVQMTRTRHEPEVECLDCDRLLCDSTRSRIRQHVKQTGHLVIVTVATVDTYEPDPANWRGLEEEQPPRLITLRTVLDEPDTAEVLAEKRLSDV